MTIHGDTSPCIDREEQELCEWAFNSGDPDTGVEWCWNCKTCGCVDINREPPSDPDADAYERNL